MDGRVRPDRPGQCRDGEAFEGITLQSGFAPKDYNFGELAVKTSKTRLRAADLFYQ